MTPIVPLAVGLGTAAASFLGGERANRANERIARENRAFQERMSSTSWQRAVKDMKLAGINPMLAFQQGGASSPGGSTTRVEDAIGPAVSSVMSLVRMRKELELMQSQKAKMDAETTRTMVGTSIDNLTAQIMGYGVKNRKGGVTPYAALSRQNEYMIQRANEQLLRAAIPGAKVSGSEMAAWLRLIYGGVSSAGVGIGAITGGLGSLLKGVAKPAEIKKIYNFPRRP